ncbi:long-chain fatty acid transport protein 2-like [Glandiceps talaboti]
MLLEVLVATFGGLFIALCIAAVSYRFFFRDLEDVTVMVKALAESKRRIRNEHTVVDVFSQTLAKFAHKPCLLFEDESYTYADIDRLGNKFANFVRKSGLKCGDTVAMFMHNEPAYIWTWLGFAKLGIKCALLNYNLRSKSLLHCLNVSKAQLLVVGKDKELQDAMKELLDEITNNGVKVWMKGATPPDHSDNCLRWIDEQITKESDESIPRDLRSDVVYTDACVYIYTSGTTGLPKPARISHNRLASIVHVLDLFYVKSEDIVYTSLPLYHSSAFLVCFSSCMKRGATVALRTKFSASHFWDDCRKFNASIVMYIGELCRYLLARPKHPDDTRHNIRMAIGNGLRPDIWTEFKERFNIPVIGEFYGATEGNAFFRNADGRVGAMGRVSPLLQRVRPFYLIKCDDETAEPIRDGNGRCVKVPLGQPGLLITRIDKMASFDGYAGKKENTQKKILQNVFKSGDQYFNSGDTVLMDKDYYLYFTDRVGDTFRWKGENVATTEVSQVLGDFPAIFEANVYGVEVPGNSDGRAGMAAITVKDGEVLDFEELYAHTTSRLPNYACPRFLRLQKKMETTGTYKHTKTQLVKESCDPSKISEPLYVMDLQKKSYVPMDNTLYQKVVNRVVKL